MAKTLYTKIFAIKDLGTWETVLKSFWRYLPSFRSLGVGRKVRCHIGRLWKGVEKFGARLAGNLLRRSTSGNQKVVPAVAPRSRKGAGPVSKGSQVLWADSLSGLV